MDALDPNYVQYSLRKLQKLNIKAVLLRRQIYKLKASLSTFDGYRKDVRLKERPGKTGPQQGSFVEDSNISKSQKIENLKTLIHELRFTEAEIEKVINSLEYRLREKEWRLLNDVYKCCFSNKDLTVLYSSKWQLKLRKIFIDYGGKPDEGSCKKNI